LGRGHDAGRPGRPAPARPLDHGVKTAAEFVRRHEQQLHAALHQQIEIAHKAGRITVSLDIEPDDENPSAVLTATDGNGQLLARIGVPPSFKLNRVSASAWAEAGFRL
jgi:hypothetical protein